jgi:curved DNA-binding protein
MAVGVSDPYETLGVSRDASDDEIRAAYRKLARTYHPDVNKDPGAEDRFKEVSEAYDQIRDADRRAEYERASRGGFGGGGGGAGDGYGGFGGFSDEGGVRVDFGEGGFDDLFDGIFGGRRRGGFGGGPGGGGFSTRGSDVEATLELSLEEAARGGHRRLTLGDGRDYEVDIPAGVRDGQRIRLSGEGRPGARGGPPGDLFLRVRIRPHPIFRVEGTDLHVELPVTPWEAALGATVPVPTLDGDVQLRVPAGSSSGRRLRLRGQGMPRAGGGSGDLYARVEVHVQKKLKRAERKAYEQLAEVSDFNPREGKW